MLTERNYIMLPSASSTNTLLKEKILSSGAAVYDVLCAERQTAGRGRLGRTFFSPRGGIYFSAAYPIGGNEKNIPFFTLLAGIAVSRAIFELTNEETQIKWPNDIYLHNKKLCGILTELVAQNGRTHIICGVGINAGVTKEEIPPELADKMTSFAAQGLAVPNKEALIKRCVENLDALVYEQKLLNETSPAVTAELDEKSFLRGKTVIYNGQKGTAGSINTDGSINIRFAKKTERIFTGEILF